MTLSALGRVAAEGGGIGRIGRVGRVGRVGEGAQKKKNHGIPVCGLSTGNANGGNNNLRKENDGPRRGTFFVAFPSRCFLSAIRCTAAWVSQAQARPYSAAKPLVLVLGMNFLVGSKT